MSEIIQGIGQGDILVWRWGSGCSIEIEDIVVRTDRRKGIGRGMVRKLIDRAQADPSVTLVWAICRANNFIAQQFYEAMRFRVVGNLRNFYKHDHEAPEDSVDAIMYGYDIIHPRKENAS